MAYLGGEAVGPQQQGWFRQAWNAHHRAAAYAGAYRHVKQAPRWVAGLRGIAACAEMELAHSGQVGVVADYHGETVLFLPDLLE